MNKCVLSAVAGIMLGVYIGYSQEEELEQICRKSKRSKKKMMKKMHHAADTICDCMDLD